MARLLSATLGKPSGKLGDNVFRIMNGKTFISSRPEHYKPTKSAKLKAARKNFAAATAFAKSVNSIPALKETWLNAKVQGTISFNRIMKANRNFVVNGLLTKNNKITPDGLPLSISSLSLQNSLLSFTLGLPVETAVAFPLTLFIFFYFKNEKSSLHYQAAKIETPSTGNTYNLSITLKNGIKKALTEDPAPLIYFAYAGVAVKNKVYWSSVTAIQL